MSQAEGKKKYIVHYHPKQPDQRMLVIKNVKKYPSLYKNEFLRTPFLHRNEKQKMWDKIAEESGFVKAEDAKRKWKSLVDYLRQHLYNVANKKPRRYAPISDNPDDKYVQLTDMPFYSEMEFIIPYVKYAASKNPCSTSNHMEMTPNEVDLILEAIEVEIEKKNEEEIKTPKNDTKQNPHTEENKQDNVTKISEAEVITDEEHALSEDDEILKEFFDNMLKSASKLPRFHQQRLKEKLLDCINEQKALNKIN